MSAVRHRILGAYDCDPEGPPAPTPLLTHLRRVSRDSRCKSFIDLFGACAALSGNREVAAQAASEILIRGLHQALGRRPVFFREGERDTSFDENWLMALARALDTDDTASATFLLHSRVPRHARRNLIFLLGAALSPPTS
ncbi:hypothetical protein BOO69_06085 [Sulfitobacter alexandrii]|uniref:Uncharacterized protein n=1 Tax=Sulfitobacter alexandrii TaxID=1917485 RepID=A0A1J0WFD8_9RHOB|nr:hypothetical protein [Sulfitobacter alexandrii]APE43034.1 hypothetical protein BOO69_06085 [Sulfitobacter alexandrii]